jgi:hypothetical protein
VLDGYTASHAHAAATGRAREALERWLHRSAEHADPFDEIFARTRLARSYADEGDDHRAIDVIEPMVESQQFGAMDCMVELLEKTGQLARAETLAVLAWGRYPDSPGAQARVLELCWRQGKYDLAARMMATAPVRLGANDFNTEVTPRFIDCFRAKPAEALRAAEAILAAVVPDAAHLTTLAAGLDRAGCHRQAFEIQSRIPAQGQQSIASLAVGYHYLRRWKGEDAARAWLLPSLGRLGPSAAAILGYVGYELCDYELVWEVEPAGGAEEVAFAWLLRAAASARMGAGRDPHRQELERHFAHKSSPRYATLGRYLLGLEDETAALASVDGAKALCETCYYIGVRAESEGAIRDAARWYQRCVETGQFSNGEYRWAIDRLESWVARNTSLAGLEAEAKHGRALTATGGD